MDDITEHGCEYRGGQILKPTPKRLIPGVQYPARTKVQRVWPRDASAESARVPSAGRQTQTPDQALLVRTMSTSYCSIRSRAEERTMSDATTNYFTHLNAIDVSAHVDKKGEFSYLNWPYAVQQLRLAAQLPPGKSVASTAFRTSRPRPATSSKSRSPYKGSHCPRFILC